MTPHDRKCGSALRMAILAMSHYAHGYYKEFGSEVGNDGVLGEEFESVLKGLIGLLNGPTGDLDCGHANGTIRVIGKDAGLTGEDWDVSESFLASPDRRRPL